MRMNRQGKGQALCVFVVMLCLAGLAGLALAGEGPSIEPIVPVETVHASNIISVAEIAILVQDTGGEDDAQLPSLASEEAKEPYDASRLHVSVQIAASRDGASLAGGEPVYYGDTIHLTGQPDNPDALPYTLQWQCDVGNGWQNVEGATGSAHTFILTEENAAWHFRLLMQATSVTR